MRPNLRFSAVSPPYVYHLSAASAISVAVLGVGEVAAVESARA
ncbi:hypothetical protein [Streptomyces sp. CS-7]|nr:hypothetical protein [Streptomyces sp. CS-7]